MLSPGILTKASHMLGPRPSLSAMPSTWYADAAVPNTNPFGKLRRLSPPVQPPSLPLSSLAPALTASRSSNASTQRLCAPPPPIWPPRRGRLPLLAIVLRACRGAGGRWLKIRESGRGTSVCESASQRHTRAQPYSAAFVGMSRMEKLGGTRRNGS